MTEKRQKIAGGLMGLLVGDALGVPYEFKPPQVIPSWKEIEFIPPVDFQRTYPQVPPGTWSDDGAQALVLLDSLLSCDKLDLNDFGQRLLRWHEEGYFAVDESLFDIGIQTSQSLLAIRSGIPPQNAGGQDPWSNGNGSLMRVLPLALWHKGSDEELIRDARLQSTVTHAHLRSQLCCALYCLWARRIIEGDKFPWKAAIEAVQKSCQKERKAVEELEWNIRPSELTEGSGSGYVVDCLHSAHLVMQRCRSYEDVVKTAVSLGNDTDTTAAVSGGVAGLREGLDAIPQRWLNALRGAEMVEPLLERLWKHLEI